MHRLTRTVVLLLALLLPLAALAQLGGTPRAEWTATIPSGAKAGDKVTAVLKAKVEEGWHVYSTKPVEGPTPTTVTAGDPLKLDGAPESINVEAAKDPNFGVMVEYITEESVIRVPVVLGDPPAEGKLQVTFQACNDKTCEFPVTVEVPLTGEKATTVVREAEAEQSELLPFMGGAFAAGLLALLTPCVFPMVPITVSYFSKRREKGGNGLGQAAAYCFGIIGAFTVFGLLVTVLFGASGIQNFATNPWVNLALAALFVFLALNLFGIVQLNVPSKVTNFFNPSGKSGIFGPILMGLTFTLTSFTCTVPFVGTVLAAAAQGEYVRPLLGMLAFGTAFSLPFFLLALFPQFLASLPKSGSWLEMVKAYMGFLEIAAAIKFLSNADLVWGTNLISRSAFLWIWVAIFAAAALFLVRIVRIPKVDIPEKIGAGRMVTVALTALVAIWLATGTSGRSLGELEAFLPPGKADGWAEIPYDRALAVAKRERKPLLIDFTGVTCTNCRWMEKNMFTRPEVESQFEKYALMKAFTDRNTPGDRANQKLMLELTKKVTLPIYVVVSPDGEVERIFEGSTRDPQEFLTFLKPESGAFQASR
jgi:thiol:disulfide interchange protein DsbD